LPSAAGSRPLRGPADPASREGDPSPSRQSRPMRAVFARRQACRGRADPPGALTVTPWDASRSAR
jgi:hypothetical protein